MARNDQLDLRIRALVEGVREVEQLTKEVDELQDQAGQSVPDSTRRFRRGVKRTETAAEKTRKTVSRLKGSFTALAGAVGAGALGAKMIRTANEMEQTRRQADALGLSVQDLSEISFSFREFGLQQDDVSDALGTLADRAEDAKEGTQSFIDDFELLNIEVDELRDKDPDELFRLVAERVSQIEDPTRRTAGVVRIFGDDIGRRLLPLLQQGSEGLEENAKRAREVGAAYDEEAAEGAAKAARTFREIRETADAQFTRLVSENAEEIDGLANAVLSLGRVSAEFGTDIIGFFQDFGEQAAAVATGDFTQSLDVIERRIRALRGQIRGPGANLIGDEERAEVQAEIERLERIRDELRLREIDTPNTLGQTLSGLPRTGGSSGGGGGSATPPDSLDETLSGLPGADAQPIDQSGAPGFRARDDLTETQIARAEEGGRVFRETRTDLENYRAEVARLDELLEAGAISQDTYNRAVAQAKDELREAGEQADESGAQLSEFAIQARRNIESQLGDSLRDALTGNFDSIEDAWRQMLFNMATEAAAAQLSEMLFGSGDQLGGVFGAALGAFSGGGGGIQTLGQTVGGLPSADGGGFTGSGPRVGGMDGRGGFAAMLHPQERVIDQARGQGGERPQVNIRTVNAIREQDVAEAMSGASGEQVILNVIGRNPESVRGALG